MKSRILLILMMFVSLQMAACGGGGSSTPGTDSNPGGGGSSNLPVVAGDYSGSYTTNVITTSTPYALSLTQSGSSLSGQFTSTKISGAVSGTVAADKSMALTVTEPRLLGTVSLNLTPTNNGYTITSVSGTDAFGTHTTVVGTAVTSTPPVATLANGYNGIGTFLNGSATSTVPVGLASGTYPVSITNLLPDGSGNYSGVVACKYVGGLISFTYSPGASLYYGMIYPGGTTPKWQFGNGGFTTADITNALNMYRYEPINANYLYTTSMTMHSGDFSKVFPGLTWTYTNPDQSATGVLSMQLQVLPTNGVGYTAQLSASVRQTVGGVVDTISSLVSGNYDLNPAVNSHVAGRVFQLKLSPVAGSSVITNNSGLTTNADLYVAWVDNSNGTNKSQISVDTGNKAWPDITLTK